jgi:hypothetical protein
MKKLSTALLLALMMTSALAAELHVYNVPDLAGGNVKPSIARNSLGDVLIVYRNNVGGAAYYFKRHDGGTLGPALVPGQNYEQAAKELIMVTDIAATPDNDFHTIWNFDIHKGKWGLYYAIFDIETEQWNSPSRIIDGRVEGPKLIVNPLNNDLLLAYDSYIADLNKDVFLKVKTAQGWQNPVNISRSTQETTIEPHIGRSAVPESGPIRVHAPHGLLAETNVCLAVDESDGYLHMTWKADKWNEEKQDWELLIVVALLNPSYERVWYGRVTRDYDGFHVLPTIAVMDGRSMVAFAWQQEAGYYYLNFVKDGESLTYDPDILLDRRIATCPLVPHWEFYSALLAHGDEFVFTYKDTAKRVNMIRFNIDGTRLDSAPIDLCNQEPSHWPHDCISDPEVGLLTVWATRDDVPSIHYSLYDYPKAIVRSPVNLQVETKLERSFFRAHYLNALTWENNPLNASRGISVSVHRVYRKPKGQDRSQYVRIGEVAGTTLNYADADGIGADNIYDYAVTCVDSGGRESLLR